MRPRSFTLRLFRTWLATAFLLASSRVIARVCATPQKDSSKTSSAGEVINGYDTPANGSYAAGTQPTIALSNARGTTTAFAITIRNSGPNAATGATVRDTLPSGLFGLARPSTGGGTLTADIHTIQWHAHAACLQQRDIAASGNGRRGRRPGQPGDGHGAGQHQPERRNDQWSHHPARRIDHQLHRHGDQWRPPARRTTVC